MTALLAWLGRFAHAVYDMLSRWRAMCAGARPGGPDRLEATRSLAQVIAEAGDEPVHVIFVHGIRATGPGTSAAFRDALSAYLGVRPPLQQRSPGFDLGPAPPQPIAGARVWTSEEAWRASRPFVDRYVFERVGAASVVVDEVNWWPLAFPLKAHVLLERDAELTGPDKRHLALCARTDPPYYPFIDQETCKRLCRHKPRSGGAPWLNGVFKHEIVEWGLADATIAIGPMRRYLHKAMQAVFAHAAAFEDRGHQKQTFVVVCESLGSFIVLDALSPDAREVGAVRDVMSATLDLYLLANQFVLLEPACQIGPAAGGHIAPLRHWAREPTPDRREGRPRQVIAFNDPGDLLTFDVPELAAVPGEAAPPTVVNLYVRNSFGFPRLFDDPMSAHTGYARNPVVLRTMFRRADSVAQSQPSA
jgi:hypothetical protein